MVNIPNVDDEDFKAKVSLFRDCLQFRLFTDLLFICQQVYLVERFYEKRNLFDCLKKHSWCVYCLFFNTRRLYSTQCFAHAKKVCQQKQFIK